MCNCDKRKEMINKAVSGEVKVTEAVSYVASSMASDVRSLGKRKVKGWLERRAT